MSFGSDAPQLAVDPKVPTKFDPTIEIGIQGRPTTAIWLSMRLLFRNSETSRKGMKGSPDKQRDDHGNPWIFF